MAHPPPPPIESEVRLPPPAPSPIYAAWGGLSSHIATPAKPWGVSLPYFYAYKSGFLRDFSAALRDFNTARLRTTCSEPLSSQVPFAGVQGGVKILPFYACKPSYALQRGAITLTQLRLQILPTL